MELNKLRHFVVTAEHKSITKAAEELDLGPPALSRSIQRLEESINGKLFERTGRGLKLTELGNTLLEYANSIISEHDLAMFALEAITKQKSGTIRIGVVRYLADFGLSTAIVNLVRRFPEAGIEVIDSSYEDLLGQLLHAKVDVIIAILTAPLSHSELLFEPVVESDLLYVAGAAHPLAKKQFVTPDDLLRARFIVSNRPAYIRSYYRSIISQSKSIQQHPLIVSSMILTRDLLESGEFVAISSRHAVAAELQDGRFVELPGEVSASTRPVGFITRQKGIQSALQTAFLEEARQALKNAAEKLH